MVHVRFQPSTVTLIDLVPFADGVVNARDAPAWWLSGVHYLYDEDGRIAGIADSYAALVSGR